MDFKKHVENWDDLGDLDACWAILTDNKRKFGRWDLEEFFGTGETDIASLMKELDRLGYPRQRHRALDFGCGVGRLTRAMAKHFDRCCGVDISEGMIFRARELNRDVANCEFVVNRAGHLRILASDSFDLVYTVITLQHLPSRSLIFAYVSEFLRILSPNGLLVFQLPSHIPFRYRLEPRRRLYNALRAVGFDRQLLYRRLGLFPVHMASVAESDMLKFLKRDSATVLEVKSDAWCGERIQSRTYYAIKGTRC